MGVIVSPYFNVVDCQLSDVSQLWINFDGGGRSWVSRELQFHLFDVVGIYVYVAPYPDEFPRRHVCLVAQKVQDHAILCDVEWDTEEYISRSLIQLQI